MKLKFQRDRGVPPRTFRVDGKKHYKVMMQLDGSDDELEKVSMVEYELHPSFKKPLRIGKDKMNNFGQEIWTYGYFPVVAKVHFKDGQVETLEEQLRFN